MIDAPLNMPKGSVRGIIAICFTVTICAAVVMERFTIQEFLPVVTMVMGFYFGQKTNV